MINGGGEKVRVGERRMGPSFVRLVRELLGRISPYFVQSVRFLRDST